MLGVGVATACGGAALAKGGGVPAAPVVLGQPALVRGQVVNFFSHLAVDSSSGAHTHSFATVNDPGHTHAYTLTGVANIAICEQRIWTGAAWVPLHSAEGAALVASLTT
jgi:hypothetical protein